LSPQPVSEPFLSVVIPAHNESGNIAATCRTLVEAFARERIRDYEVLVVDDGSTDGTGDILRDLAARFPEVRHVDNPPPHGFGMAVRRGLSSFRGEAVCLVMADLSDSPDDVVAYYRKLREGWECVFGSRFMRGGRTCDYPLHKLILNRLANHFIKRLFRIEHDDFTNAFKAYRREVIDGVQPILAKHFNLTVELPLKAMVRGYTWCRVPISWRNRTSGVSKLRIKEMGSRYLFIVLYVWLEKALSKGDYRRTDRARRVGNGADAAGVGLHGR
jgi:dolichol-phosphate mannosyltransferase